MNDDTVPDVGMTIGSGEVKVPSQSWRKCLAKALALAAFCVHADVETVDGIEWTYFLSDGKAEISGSSESPAIPDTTEGRITVPGTLGGCPVTRIGFKAFYYCNGITAVTVPEGIEEIDAKAFYSCNSLAEVDLPDSLVSLGKDAFIACSTNLYDHKTSKGVRLVDGWAVQCASGALPEILDLSGVRGIADELFSSSRGASRVLIAGGIPSVPYKAFCKCMDLEQVVFLGPVGEIGRSAFEACQNLAGISGLRGITNIAAEAFSECDSLERILIPGTVRCIGKRAFYKCGSLCDVEFLGDRPRILTDAFQGSRAGISENSIVVVSSDASRDDVPVWQAELEGAADARLSGNITDDAKYSAFLGWAGRLLDETPATVKASPCAWLSYALDSASLIGSAPAAEDVRITAFVPSVAGNTFDMSVSVAGVSVGGKATAENLGTVFAVEGAAAPDENLFGTNGVAAAFGVPADGQVRLSVSPEDASANGFFFRVKLK